MTTPRYAVRPSLHHADEVRLLQYADADDPNLATVLCELPKVDLQALGEALMASGEFVPPSAVDVPRLRQLLRGIVAAGGTQSDESLTGRTGPNDAAHRGMMYVTARSLAREGLSILDGGRSWELTALLGKRDEDEPKTRRSP